MNKLTELFESVKSCESYSEKNQILSVVLNACKSGNGFSQAELAEVKAFVTAEIKALPDAILAEQSYKSMDAMFYYGDLLLTILDFARSKGVAFSSTELGTAQVLVDTVTKFQVLETSMNDMYKRDKITKEDAQKVVDVAGSLTDEYQKSIFYSGLLKYRNEANKFTEEAKAVFADYIALEIERFLSKRDGLTEDEENSLEIAADVCKDFINGKLIGLLQKVLELTHNNIRYYAVATLLSCKQSVPTGVISELARDLVYADQTYSLLKMHGLESMFPKELSDPEYLAKSDMVHWLYYPTELGKVPDEIELLGKVKSHGSPYYIFKYKSDSDNLTDDMKNVWLIGWSSVDGGTFSNFDKLSDYEQKKPEKTLKTIKKKILD